MIREIIILLFGTSILVVSGSCPECTHVKKSPVCGSDKNTYESFCFLKRVRCLKNTKVKFECDGMCPCDPDGIEALDGKTFKTLEHLRREIQLEGHEAEESDKDSNDSDRIVLEILEDQKIKKELEEGEQDRQFLENERYALSGCPTNERVQLPQRLIDWFHVLKTNEREQQYSDQGIRHEPILRELKFIDAKLKAMYARLACDDNDEEVEKEVCLPSVKWMFYHMDTNQDDNLSPVELLEIEEINSEYCIKPFLKSCDQNNDGRVELKEFCKCLCVTPPCTHALESIPTILVRGEPRPFPGLFEPKCDEDGFFMPRQHNKRRGVYWCVNRNGAEIEGTRNATKSACALNTKETTKYQKLIPLDMKKENDIVSDDDN